VSEKFNEAKASVIRKHQKMLVTLKMGTMLAVIVLFMALFATGLYLILWPICQYFNSICRF